MKKCTKCSIEKSITEYHKREFGKPTSWCKSCRNHYSISKWKKRKHEAIITLGGVCVDCGFNKHQHAFDFHHLRDKKFNWNKLRLRNDEDIKIELSKCILLCANCHRIRHASS